MAEEKKVIIDVDFNNLIDALKELKRQYDVNIEKMQQLADEGKEDSAQYKLLIEDNKVLKSEMRSVETQMRNNIKAQRADADSLVQLRAKLSNLQKQFDQMGKNDPRRDGLQKQIAELHAQVMNLEGSTGRWQRNVGNYQSALQGLSTDFRAAGLSCGVLDRALKMLTVNPVVAMLGALALAAKGVAEAIKSDEQATMALKESFALLNPYIDTAKNALSTFADKIVWEVSTAIKGLTLGIGNIIDKYQRLANLFGADVHWADNYKSAVTAAEELAKAENDYIEKKRVWTVASKQMEKEVADLRAMAAEKDKYTAEERLAYLDKAIAIETKKARLEKKMAEENLNLLSREAARTRNNAEMNDKLAQARAAVIQAEINLSNTIRNLQRQRQSAVAETKKQNNAEEEENETTKELNKSLNQTREALELITMTSYDEWLDATAKKNKKLADDIKSVADRLNVLRTEVGGLVDADRADVEGFTDVVADAPTSLEQFAAAYERNADRIEATSSSLQGAFSSLSGYYSKLAASEAATEEERAEAAQKAQQWSTMQVVANTAVAMAKGIAGAMAEPFPANIAALATTIAALVSAIAEIKSLSFETGGVVGGFHGATMGRDNTVAQVRRGEMILNASQQRRLFEIANSGVRDSEASALAAALRNMPAPVLVYSEFERFGRSVTIMNENAKLR